MKQAKVLTDAELKRLLAVAANNRHSERNRIALMLSHLAGLRVGEIAALSVGDVVDGEGYVRDQLRLKPSQLRAGLRSHSNTLDKWRLVGHTIGPMPRAAPTMHRGAMCARRPTMPMTGPRGAPPVDRAPTCGS